MQSRAPLALQRLPSPTPRAHACSALPAPRELLRSSLVRAPRPRPQGCTRSSVVATLLKQTLGRIYHLKMNILQLLVIGICEQFHLVETKYIEKSSSAGGPAPRSWARRSCSR